MTTTLTTVFAVIGGISAFEVEAGHSRESTRLAYCEAASMLREVQFRECTAVEKRIMSPDSYEAERRFKEMTAKWPKHWRKQGG